MLESWWSCSFLLLSILHFTFLLFVFLVLIARKLCVFTLKCTPCRAHCLYWLIQFQQAAKVKTNNQRRESICVCFVFIFLNMRLVVFLIITSFSKDRITKIWLRLCSPSLHKCPALTLLCLLCSSHDSLVQWQMFSVRPLDFFSFSRPVFVVSCCRRRLIALIETFQVVGGLEVVLLITISQHVGLVINLRGLSVRGHTHIQTYLQSVPTLRDCVTLLVTYLQSISNIFSLLSCAAMKWIELGWWWDAVSVSLCAITLR